MFDKGRAAVGFVGTGKVGAALALRLHEAGYRVAAVSSARGQTARALVSRIEGCLAVSPREVANACDVVFIATPDATIAEVCESIGWRLGRAAVHTSGALSSNALSAASAAGAETGSFHPLQTFADGEQAFANLPGSLFAIEAEGSLRAFLETIAADLGGAAIHLRPEDKVLYHAAAVMVSNYTVALAKAATDLWLLLGIDRATALRGLLPLLRGTLANLEALGLPGALTGPIARGDVETVRRHAAALQEAAPGLLPLYRELGLQTIPLALARGGLGEAAAAELRELFQRQESATPGGNGP